MSVEKLRKFSNKIKLSKTCLFASVAVQKNVRDLSKFNDENPTPETPEKPHPTARFDNPRPQKPTLGRPDEQS